MALSLFDPDTEDALGTYASMPAPPRMPQKRRGLFGGKVDMEDFQMALARAAAYFQGDYEGAAAITGHMGKARQGRLDAAQLATALASDTSLTDEQRQLFAMAPDKFIEYKMGQWKQPERTNSYREYIDAGYTDAEAQAQMRLDAKSRRDKIVTTTQGGAAGTYSPDAGYTPILLPNSGDRPMGAPASGGVTPFQDAATGKTYYRVGNRVFDNEAEARAVGGGASNGPGSFRP